jgi:uncharacterized membrane protein YhaH (DUF805 family)
MTMFARRSGRTEYWLSTAGLIVVGFLLDYLVPGKATAAPLFAWILIWSWRLHDFGKSGWFNLIPIGSMILVTAIAIAFMFSDKEFSDALGVMLGKSDAEVTARGVWLALAFLIALLGTQLAYMVWLGVKRGDPGENEFGPPTSPFGKAKATTSL